MVASQEHSPWQSTHGGQRLPLPSANKFRSQMGIEAKHTQSLNAHLQPCLFWKKGSRGRGGGEAKRRSEGMCIVIKNRNKR